MQLNQTGGAECLSTGHVAAVAATAWVIGKENISSEINISGLG